jgi:hypothetical protein
MSRLCACFSPPEMKILIAYDGSEFTKAILDYLPYSGLPSHFVGENGIIILSKSATRNFFDILASLRLPHPSITRHNASGVCKQTPDCLFTNNSGYKCSLVKAGG